MKIEFFTRPDGLLEERHWGLSSVSYEGKIIQVGKRLHAIFIYDKNGEEVNKKSFISKNDQLFTEDVDFYSNVVGVDVRPFIGLSDKEFHEKILEEMERLKEEKEREA